MPMTPDRSSVTIIGGGASGVILAVQLLRQAGDLRVTLLDRAGEYGQGVAYSTRQRDHRVNVPARGMSAFADEPDHFVRWLEKRGWLGSEGSYTFVPRRLYGTYLNDVLQQAAAAEPGRLIVRASEAMAVRESAQGVETILADDTSIVSRYAVLAVGHETQPARGKGIAVRVGSTADTPLASDAPVIILGSGLSMVDAWLRLAQADHKGPIFVVSRNGLLPKAHCDVPPRQIVATDVPFGTNLPYIVRWFRRLVAETVSAGGDWRNVVDGLRPYNQRIWQSWTERTKRQALRHLRPWWNIHRHRLPPDLHDRLNRAVTLGQVRLVAAEFIDIERSGDDVRATIRPRGSNRRETIDVARVYDCGGVSVDVEASSNPVIRELVSRGAARPDVLHIGLDVTPECQVLDRLGVASRHLFVVGPLTRGRFFEIEAIPDIRLQCAALARALAEGSR